MLRNINGFVGIPTKNKKIKMKLSKKQFQPFMKYQYFYLYAILLYFLSVIYFAFYFGAIINFRVYYFQFMIYLMLNFGGFFILMMVFNHLQELKDLLLECRAVNKILESDKNNLFKKLKEKK